MRADAVGARAILRRVVPARLRSGVWKANGHLRDLQQRAFERRLGVATSGHAYLDDVADSKDRTFYEGCEWLPVRRALSDLGPGPDDVFVDLGSGKGQALFIAGRLSYRRVIGVELLEELVRDAEKNIERARPRLRCPDVQSLAVDVLHWPVPDDVSTVFMYCPFFGEVFHQAIERFFDSYDRNPRSLRLVYAYPWEHDWLIQTGRVVVENVTPAQWPTKPWWWRSGWVIVTYQVVAAGQGCGPAPRLPRRIFRPRRAVERWNAPNDQRYKLYRPGAEPLLSHP